MQQSALLSQVMPMALGIIMLGLGLSLTLDDFRRVTQYPRAIIIALGSQMILLPAICLVLVRIFDMDPALGVGLMLLSAAPGGATASLYSHLSKGDVALNITLTAVNCVLALFTLPFIVNFSLEYFLSAGQYIPMPFQKVIEVFAIVLTPVIFGMIIRRATPGLASKMDRPVKIASVLFLALIIITLTIQQRAMLGIYLVALGLPVLTFNIVSLATGYFLPQWFKVEKKQAIAIGMEIGIHNATLAIYIALNVLNNTDMSIAPALYGLLMFFTAGVFGYLVSRGTTHIGE